MIIGGTMSTPLVLEGIVLDIDHQALYLKSLSHVLSQQLPQMTSTRATIETLLSASLSPSLLVDHIMLTKVLPYTIGVAVALIDREWFESEDNEFAILTKYIESHRLIGSVKSVFIWGAGTCRLGDYLAALDTVQSVICADISWLILYFGKALIERRIDLLPRLSRADRVYYEVNPHSQTLIRTTKSSSFMPPFHRETGKLEYLVRDAFYSDSMITADLICLPFLLDHFEGPRLTTLLIRICQHLHVGQQLLILVSCAPGRRNPTDVLTVLKELGFSIDILDLVEMPYTASYYDFAHFRNVFNTLVVRATRTHDPAPTFVAIPRVKGDFICGAPSEGTVKVRRQNGVEITLSERSAAILSTCYNNPGYQQLQGSAKSSFELIGFNHAVGELTSNELIDLGYV
jgi:hypothetical protein